MHAQASADSLPLYSLSLRNSIYVPVLSEAQGLYEVISGTFQKAHGEFMEEHFGSAMLYSHRALHNIQEGQYRIDQGYAKLPTVGTCVATLAALYFASQLY